MAEVRVLPYISKCPKGVKTRATRRGDAELAGYVRTPDMDGAVFNVKGTSGVGFLLAESKMPLNICC